MIVVNKEMLIDTVDEQDAPIGVIKRSDALAQNVNFRVLHLFLFNRHGALLLQQLGLGRDRYPGRWGSSVAAYVATGETYGQAAKRRLGQELGVRTQLTPVGKTSMLDEASKKFITLFTGTSDGPFAYDHDHIAQLEYLRIPEIRECRDRETRSFTPTFLHVLDFYLERHPV